MHKMSYSKPFSFHHGFYLNYLEFLHHQPINHQEHVLHSKILFLYNGMYNLLQLFLGAKLSGVSTLLLAAILSTRWETSIAFTADSLVAVESLGQQSKRWIVNSSSQTKNQMKSRLLLNIVVGKSAAIF